MEKKKFNVQIVEDGASAIVAGSSFKVRAFEDYEDEVINGENECAYVFVYHTLIDQNGDEFVLWGDRETDEDFITYVK